MSHRDSAPDTASNRGWLTRSLDIVERLGNRLADSAMLFLLLMLLAGVISSLLSRMTFTEIDPRTGIGTLVALMLPYSLTFIVFWMSLLLAFWGLDLPLGVSSTHEYLPSRDAAR